MLVWLLFLVTRTPAWAAENPPPIQLSSDTSLSSEGYFVLDWTAPSGLSGLALQVISSADATTAKIINDSLPGNGSITLTGLSDGEYRYQLLVNNQVKSNQVTVLVRHHAMSRALGFFSLGLLLFAILVTSIVIGNRRTRQHHGG